MAYEDRLVTFFDIMGWKEKTLSAVDNVLEQNELEAVLRIFDVFKEVPIEGQEPSGVISTFSDNVIVSIKNDPDYLGAWIKAMASIQVGLALDGYLVRGAISSGLLHHDKNTVFGPALNHAFGLESKVAFYPRIIVDGALPLSDETIAFIGKRPNETVHTVRTFSDTILSEILVATPNAKAVSTAITVISQHTGLTALKAPTDPTEVRQTVLKRLEHLVEQLSDIRVVAQLRLLMDDIGWEEQLKA